MAKGASHARRTLLCVGSDVSSLATWVRTWGALGRHIFIGEFVVLIPALCSHLHAEASGFKEMLESLNVPAFVHIIALCDYL